MRILHVSDCYPPRFGGIETQVHGMATRQQAAGHHVEVVTATPGHGEVRSGLDAVDGVPVHRLALRLPAELPVNPLAPPELRRILDAGRFDVAHVHLGVVSPFAVDGMRVLAKAGHPAAVTVHCVWGYLEAAFDVLDHITGWSRRRVAWTAVSDFAAEPVRRVMGEDVGVIPNGIDPMMWRTQAGPRPAGGPVRVVSAMRLARRKRPMAMLEVLEAAAAQLPGDLRLEAALYGEGPRRASLERHLRRRRLDWITLPGRRTPTELRAAYASADLFLSTARLEAFGIAALEGRTAGLPVVARADSGVREFIHDGVEGLLADSDEGLAAAVARLAADSVERRRLADHNRAVEPASTWDGVLARTEEEYLRAIALAGSGGPSAQQPSA